MKTTKKLLAVFLAVVMCLAAAPLQGFEDFGITASALADSGSCGENVTYTYDSTTGELVISGTGAMTDYYYYYSPFYNSDIKSVVIEDGVTSIGGYIFHSCTSLESITIPDSVTSIGNVAFAHCTSLASVTIPDSVTSIGDVAFGYCTSLASVTIGDSVTSIGSQAFRYCESLQSVTIGDSVTSIGLYAFEDCTSLQSVTIPDSVTSIGDEAFNNCTSLESVTIPDSVTSIGDYAFLLCTSLESITVEADNQYYSSDEYGALFNKDKTTLIQYPIGNTRTAYSIPDSVTSIGDYAFNNCTSLESVTIPDSVTSIGDYAFLLCTSLESITVEADNQYYSSDEYGALFNKDKTTLIQYPIGNTRTAYSIPDSVTSIGDAAFAYCASLESVTIPDSVTSIGNYAFYDCESLASVTIPDSVTSISDSAFEYCTSLTSVTIGNSVTSIGSRAFYKCTSLTDVYYGGTEEQWNSITIGEYNECLTGATIHFGTDIHTHSYTSAVTKAATCTEAGVITYTCSCGDSYTEEISIVEHKDDNNDSYCDNCGENIFTEDRTILSEGQCGDNVFYTLYSDGELVITGTGAMYDYEYEGSPFYSSDIKSVVIEDGVTSIGSNAFYYCTSLASVTIGDSVTSIGYWVFYNCTSLASVTIGDSVTSIGDDAFSGCTSLESITIPDSVTSIGVSAFYECTSLTDVYYGGTEEQWSAMYIGAYNGCLTGATIHFLGEEAHTHSYTSAVTKEATCTEAGVRTYTCSCGDSYTEEISIVEHKDDNNDSYCDNCGENIFTEDRTILSEGQCGDNVFYTLYSDDELVVSGTGAMTNYNWSSSPFYNSDIKSVVIEDGVTSIGSYAFAVCTSLTSVTIPDSVTSIGSEAFKNCISLASITVNADNQHYLSDEYGVLFNKDKTTLIQYPIGNTGTTYIIPDSVTSIGDYAFAYCENLEGITIPDSVTSIGDSAFRGCTSLESVTIPDSVTSIGDSAFYDCESLASVTIPDSVTSIGEMVFFYCTSLASVTIPDSVTTIGEYAFAGCTSLESITIPDSVTTIGYGAFGDCTSLESITIPDSVTSIGGAAFAYCTSLTSITIPDSVTSIGDDAFYNCTSLTDVYYGGTEEQWNSIIIADGNECLTGATIHFLGEEEHICTPVEQIIPATCTVNGLKFYICAECGEPVGESEIIPAAHTPGEWETLLEATYEAEGKKVKKCTVCGEILEEEIIPKLQLSTVEDEQTGVSIDYPQEKYDGQVNIIVEETFDGTAFNILDTKAGAIDSKIYDIKLLVNGSVTQPEGKVTVKIPLPSGYNPAFSFVYYVNSETGALEKMDAVYSDGYMIFETDHFSYYAVIEVADTENCSCRCHSNSFFQKLIWKITLFFQKLFGMNKVCECGVEHY